MTQQHNQTSSTYSAASVIWPISQPTTELILPITDVLPDVRKHLGASYIQINDTAVKFVIPYTVNCNEAFNVVLLLNNLYNKAISEETECKRVKGTFKELYPFASALIADIYQTDDDTSRHIKICNKCGPGLVHTLLERARYTGIAMHAAELSVGSASIPQGDKLDIGTKHTEHLKEEIKPSEVIGLSAKDAIGSLEVAKREDKHTSIALDTLAQSNSRYAALDSVMQHVKDIHLVSPVVQPDKVEMIKMLHILEAAGYKLPQELTSSLPHYSSDHPDDVHALTKEDYTDVLKQQQTALDTRAYTDVDIASDNSAREVCVGQDCQNKEVSLHS